MISPVLKDYSNHLEDLVKMSQPIYYRYICMNSRLTDQVKQLMADVSAACQTLAKISSSAGELQKLNESFNSQVKSHKLTSMSEVYAALNQSMSSMGSLNLICRICLAKTDRPAQLEFTQNIHIHLQRARRDTAGDQTEKSCRSGVFQELGRT